VQVIYDDGADLLYLRFDDRRQDVLNRRVADGIVLDVGADDRIVGIEILDASKQVDLGRILPVEYRAKQSA
jgi:uncharacterized protein YuzE